MSISHKAGYGKSVIDRRVGAFFVPTRPVKVISAWAHKAYPPTLPSFTLLLSIFSFPVLSAVAARLMPFGTSMGPPSMLRVAKNGEDIGNSRLVQPKHGTPARVLDERRFNSNLLHVLLTSGPRQPMCKNKQPR